MSFCFHCDDGVKSLGFLRHPIQRSYRVFLVNSPISMEMKTLNSFCFYNGKKNQSCGIEALWSMQRFTCWEPKQSDIIYLLRIKCPFGNEQFHPLKMQVKAGSIIRKSNIAVKNWENASAIYWHENIKVEKKLICLDPNKQRGGCLF